MEKLTSLKTTLLPVHKLVVADIDKDGNSVEQTYSLILDYNAISKASEGTGLDLARLENWHGLNAAQLSTVLWASFDRFHPDVTLKEVRRMIAPVDHYAIFGLLIEAAYPGISETIIQNVKADEAGKLPPNVLSSVSV